MLDVTLVPILADNYAYILQSGSETAILDPGEATPIIKRSKKKTLYRQLFSIPTITAITLPVTKLYKKNMIVKL